MDCPICYRSYCSTNFIPKVLPCGHSICSFCLSQLVKDHRNFKCPECRQAFLSSEERSFPTNYAILKEEKKIRYKCSKHNSPTEFICLNCQKEICQKCITEKCPSGLTDGANGHNLQGVDEFTEKVKPKLAKLQKARNNQRDFEKKERGSIKCLLRAIANRIEIQETQGAFTENLPHNIGGVLSSWDSHPSAQTGFEMIEKFDGVIDDELLRIKQSSPGYEWMMEVFNRDNYNPKSLDISKFLSQRDSWKILASQHGLRFEPGLLTIEEISYNDQVKQTLIEESFNFMDVKTLTFLQLDEFFLSYLAKLLENKPKNLQKVNIKVTTDTFQLLEKINSIQGITKLEDFGVGIPGIIDSDVVKVLSTLIGNFSGKIVLSSDYNPFGEDPPEGLKGLQLEDIDKTNGLKFLLKIGKLKNLGIRFSDTLDEEEEKVLIEVLNHHNTLEELRLIFEWSQDDILTSLFSNISTKLPSLKRFSICSLCPMFMTMLIQWTGFISGLEEFTLAGSLPAEESYFVDLIRTINCKQFRLEIQDGIISCETSLMMIKETLSNPNFEFLNIRIGNTKTLNNETLLKVADIVENLSNPNLKSLFIEFVGAPEALNTNTLDYKLSNLGHLLAVVKITNLFNKRANSSPSSSHSHLRRVRNFFAINSSDGSEEELQEDLQASSR